MLRLLISTSLYQSHGSTIDESGASSAACTETLANLESVVHRRTQLMEISMNLKIHLNVTAKTWVQFQSGDMHHFLHDFIQDGSRQLSESTIDELGSDFKQLQHLIMRLELISSKLKNLDVSINPMRVKNHADENSLAMTGTH